MNRDDVQAGAVIALATGELMVTARRLTARRLTARLPRLNESAPSQVAAAVAVVRAGVAGIWPKIPPEAARDVMVTAAGMACAAGVTTVPEPITEMLPGQLDAAGGILALTAEWRAETYPGDRHAGVPMGPGVAMPPPLALASSVAFDRAEDRETCSSVPVLLTLAHLAIPGRVSLSDAEAESESARPATWTSRAAAGLHLGVPAAHLPRRRHSQERDRRQPVRAAGPRHRPDRRGAEGPPAGPRRRGGHHHPVAAARARRRRARDGPHARPARPAGPGGPPAGPGPGPDHLPRGPAGLQAVHPDLVGRHHPRRRPRRRRRQHR